MTEACPKGRARGAAFLTPIVLVAAFFLLRPLVVRGTAPPEIAAVSTWFQGRELRVFARLSSSFPVELEKRLASGLPTTVVWQIGLFRFREMFWDNKRDERRYAVTATYRPLTGDFVLERRLDDRLLETRVVPARPEAVRALTEVPSLPAFLLGEHLAGKQLLVKVRCAFEAGVALGVVPKTIETDWMPSSVFTWEQRPGATNGP